MEDALAPQQVNMTKLLSVLILVVMEDALAHPWVTMDTP